MIHKIEHVSEGFVRVHIASIISGNINSMVLPTRQGELEFWEESDYSTYDLFPHFNADQIKFLITGVTPSEVEEFECL